MMDEFDSVLAADIEAAPDMELLAALREMIVQADANKPRSLQRMPGPSEVGHHCQRKLAYLIHASRQERPDTLTRGVNRSRDPLAAILGTAMHSWLEEAARMDNARLGWTRWIPETRVEVRPGLEGTCDLYDMQTHSALDWKVLGNTSYQKLVKNGPSKTYRAQRLLYGRGYKRKGFPVQYVGNVVISRTGTLRQTHLDREPYDDAAVDEILARIDSVEGLMTQLNVEHDPRGFLQIPITPDDDCIWCPWHSVRPSGPFGCGGADDHQRML